MCVPAVIAGSWMLALPAASVRIVTPSTSTLTLPDTLPGSPLTVIEAYGFDPAVIDVALSRSATVDALFIQTKSRTFDEPRSAVVVG